jgi:hypothetical protein
MTDTPIRTLPPTERRRLIARGLLRALASTTVLIALYFLAPIGHIERVPVGGIARRRAACSARRHHLADTCDHPGRAPGSARHRSTGHHRAAVPSPVRGHLLPVGASRPRELQHPYADPYRRPVLCCHDLRHGRFWGHHGHESDRATARLGPDDLGSARPRPRAPSVPRCRSTRSPAPGTGSERSHRRWLLVTYVVRGGPLRT